MRERERERGREIVWVGLFLFLFSLTCASCLIGRIGFPSRKPCRKKIRGFGGMNKKWDFSYYLSIWRIGFLRKINKKLLKIVF